MVENGDECGVALPVHLAQFNADKAHLAEHSGPEEEARGIKGA